jgi:hypothetical protein
MDREMWVKSERRCGLLGSGWLRPCVKVV